MKMSLRSSLSLCLLIMTMIVVMIFPMNLFAVNEPGSAHLLSPLHFGDKDWSTVNEVRGPTWSVSASARDSLGNLYVVGSFTQIGNTETGTYNRVAKWNGHAWEPLGQGLNNTATDIAIDSEDNVYVCGDFTSAGGEEAIFLAKWDGHSWSNMWKTASTTTGVGSVKLFALHIDDNDNLYVGGDFRKIIPKGTATEINASGIAVWNGTEWNPLGLGTGAPNDAAMHNYVHAITKDSSNNVYAGGNFSVVGDPEAPGGVITVNSIARWDGTRWHAMGSAGSTGVRIGTQRGYVSALMMQGNTLYVGGLFETAGTTPVGAIAKWESGVWSNPGITLTGSCRAIDTDPAGNIYLGGSLGNEDSDRTMLYRFNGTTWGALQEFYARDVRIQSIVASGPNELFIGGNFLSANGHPDLAYLAKYSSGKLEPLYYHVNGKVNTVVRAPNGNIYIGGEFTRAGNVSANNIAYWNGTSWRAVSSVLEGPNGVNGPVHAIAISPDGRRLFAGGSFTHAAGSVAANNVAYFGLPPAGQIQIPQWQALSTGTSGTVRALAFDASQLLVAAGDFVQASGNTVNYIARFQSNQWVSLGQGMNHPIRALAVDKTGIIYAGGAFTTAGGNSASRIAYYDGTWKPLGAGVNSLVETLATDEQNHVYAGGMFVTAGGTTVNYIAKWDGNGWNPIGKGITGQAVNIRSIAVAPSGRIYAGGDFSDSTDSPYNYLAVWDGSSWTSAGGGLNKPINGLALDAYGGLFSGGEFNQIFVDYIPPFSYTQTSGYHFAYLWNRTLRVAGTNRYTTAIAISRQGWPEGADAVVISRGDDYPDALAAVPFAYLLDAPILLTVPATLGASARAEIQRLAPKKIYLIGGTGAISQATEDLLTSEGYTVQRIRGNNRYETAISIAEQMVVHGASYDTAFIVQGTNFPDALSAGAYAAMRGEPIILTPTGVLPDVVASAIANLDIKRTFVIGGTGAISDSVLAQLPDPERISGDNRYLTSTALLQKFMDPNDRIYLSTGTNYPDAIAGGVLAAKTGTGLLLVYGPGNTPSPAAQHWLWMKKVNQAILFGGPASMSTVQEEWLRANLPLHQ